MSNKVIVNGVDVSEAIERNTPMKPKPSKNPKSISARCLLCDKVVMPNDNFCYNCGQRLDWSNE